LHPGLVNAHTHGHGGLQKGMGDCWTLELLLAAGPWIGGARQLGDRRLASLLCAAEMALKGCTAAYDLTAELPLPTVEGFDACAGAYADVGMRAVLAPMVADLTLYEAIPGLRDALPEARQREVDALRLAPAEACLGAMAAIAKGWRWAAHDIRLAIAPTIPLHCTEGFMAGCVRLAHEHGLGLHSHVGESRVQAVSAIRRYGRTLVAECDRLGLVGPDFTVAHGIWLDDDDLARLADRGASVSHNPGSNLKLGNGVARLRAMLDRGVNVALGSDGPGSADNQNMFEAMRDAARLSRLTPDPRAWVSATEVFRAATEGGAKALGFEKCGRIAPGFHADLVFLDLGHVNWLPHNNSVNQLVHVEDSRAVKHVMVAGRFIVENGRLARIDHDRLAAEAEAARARLEAATADARDLFTRLQPIIASYCPALAQVPYHLDRYLESTPRF
ncbi:MAG: amidohydrolase family protein, partial [Acetobacteraceae bacterium]|nr:amidohydrolase family protein [Acetobacteraceae bacterium]